MTNEVARVGSDEAIDRLLGEIRKRLESAFANGQKVSVDFRDCPTTGRIPTKAFERTYLQDLVAGARSDGSCEYHIYIGRKGAR